MDYIDKKYIHLVSASLENFKQKGENLYNFRCVFCGDSQTNKTKARGYIFEKENKPIFKCHNCGQGATLNNLLKHVNPALAKEYALEKFGTQERRKPISPASKPSLRFQKRPEYLKTPLGKLKRYLNWILSIQCVSMLSHAKFLSVCTINCSMRRSSMPSLISLHLRSLI